MLGIYIRPGVFRGCNIALSVKCDVTESIAIDELHRPVEDANDALQNAEGATGSDVAGVRFLLLCDAAGLSEQVDNGYNQTAEADAAEAVGKCTA